MINKRLIEFLENNKMLTNIKCGLSERRSTIDHLLRLETYIRKSMGLDMFRVSIFFDLEKAYDTTWRYGMLKDLYGYGLRGRLPNYIAVFLKDRQFTVTMNGVHSAKHQQISGVPQGSVLSVALFAVKINSLAKSDR